MNDGIVTRLSWIFLAGVLVAGVIGAGFWFHEHRRDQREAERRREVSRQIDDGIVQMQETSERIQRQIQIERAKLNKARESEIMRIEALQASGGSKEAQRWIDGYEGGRLGNK